MTKKLDYDRVLGSLLGFAIGDAMGATTEFMTEQEIFHRYGMVENIIGGGWLGLRPGEVTDDTQMMTIVAKARMGGKENFLQDCCSGFVEWLRGGPIDVGEACRVAIYRGGGKSPDEWMRFSKERQKAQRRLDLGNGAVMRALFLALSGETDLAILQGRLTHNNGVSDQGIKDYCCAIQETLGDESWALEGKAESLMDPTGHVRNSVNNAIYWHTHTDSFQEAILGSVNHGGDADTIAALTGGIAGAYWGVSSISRKWIKALDPRVVVELENMANWLIHQ